MTKFYRFALISLALLAGSVYPTQAQDSSAPVAKIGETVLTEEQMRKELATQLYQLENNAYMTKKNWVDQKAQEVLFDKAAKEAKMKRKDWEAYEIDKKMAPPNEETIKQMVTQLSSRPGTTPEAAMKQAREQATMQARFARRNQLYQELSQKTPVELLLVKPVAPRVDVTYASDDPMKGDAKAPVTIVEFTDFECPYCSRAQGTLKQIEQAYPKEVKIVARQYPLPFHGRAKPAAVAALCAKDQGKYWEYRDKLFENQQKLQDTDFRQYAKDIGLNSQKFEKCLASNHYAARVDKDMADGQKFGVSGTPAFFVNGEFISGAQPFPVFQQAIQSALALKK